MKHNIFIRFLSMFLSLLMAVSVLPFSVWAQNLDESNDPTEKAEPIIYEEDIPEYSTPVIEDGSRGDNIIDNIPVGEIFYTQEGLALRLNIKGDSYSVVDFINPAATLVTIPATYSGLPVNRIADSAFKDMVNLVTVTLHDGIEYIGDDVFGGCTALQFNVLDGVNYLGTATNDYFYAHSALITDKVNNTSDITNYKAPASTKIIASYAFYNCKELKTVEFHKDIIQVGFRSLRGCDNIEEVTLPFAGEVIDGDTNSHLGFAFGARTYGGNISFVPLTLKKLHVLGGTLQKNALFGLDGITHLTLPRMTAHLGYYYGAETYSDNINYIPASLISVSVQSGDIPDYAFYNCVKITDVELCDGVTSIGEYAFSYCTSLTNAKISDNVAFMGYSAFRYCSMLKRFTIPDSITSIDSSMFKGCTSLTSIDISDSVTSIGGWAFEDCTSLTNVTIPNNVTLIGYHAFYNCTSLVSVVVGNGVDTIAEDAFYKCKSLKDVHISNIEAWCEIDFLGYNYYSNPLSYAENLYLNGVLITDLVIPDGVESIGKYAFASYNSLTSITIPASITFIDEEAFVHCTSLIAVYISDLAAWCQIDFGSDYYSNPLYCAENLYLNGMLLTDMIIPKGVTSIGDYAFQRCTNLTSITIPNSVISIGDSCFEDCYLLKCVTISDSVTSIGDSALDGCGNLTSIIFNGTYSQWVSIKFGSDWNNYTGNYTIYCSDATVSRTGAVTYLANVVAYEKSLLNTNPYIKLSSFSSTNDVMLAEKSYVTAESISVNFLSVDSETVTCSDGLKYTSNGDGTCYVSGIGSCSDANIVIPSVSNLGDIITSIGDSAFFGCKALKNITIPDTVTSIGFQAFYNCTSLTNITIPDSVSLIGYDAFRGCTSLVSIKIGNGVTSINDNAFYMCTLLETVTIGNGVISIGDRAFDGCSQLKSVTIPDSVTSIGARAFADCSSLESVIIGNSITSIGSSAFWYCTSLTSITIPDSVTSIGDYAFSGCTSLSSAIIGNNVVSIGMAAFFNCISLMNLIIPNSVTTIGYQAFYNCALLTSITVGNGVTTIGYMAFAYCTSLAAVYISDLAAWCRIDFDDNPLYYAKKLYLNGVLVTDLVIPDGITSINYAFPSGVMIKSVTIPDSVTSIGDSAFADCSSLASVTIPNSVTSIGYRAFSNCVSLKNVTISNGVVSIGEYIFDNCTSLISVTLPDNVITIGNYAFNNCTSLENITIGNGVSSISSQVFEGCTKLTSVTIGKSLKSIGYNAFSDCTSLKAVYISDLTAWCQINFGGGISNPLYYAKMLYLNGSLVTDMVIPQGVISISDYAFQNCTYLNSIVITDGVTSIGSSAFDNCTSLTSVTIPESVTSIGYGAFSDCTSLTAVYISDLTAWCHIDFAYFDSNPLYYARKLFLNGSLVTDVVIPEDVCSICDYAFQNCTSLVQVIISDGIESIGAYAFNNCSSLDSVTIGKKVTSIGVYAFYGCTSLAAVNISDLASWCKIDFDSASTNPLYYAKKLFLNGSLVTELVIPQGVSSIGSYTFYNYTFLTSITILDSVTSIGYNAFYNCTLLTSISIPASVETISKQAFSGCSSLEKVTFAEGSKIGFIGSQAFAGTNLNKGKETGNKTIYYPGDINEWRFVQKATDWDGDLAITYDQIQCNPITVLYDMKDDKSEFFVSEFVGTEDTEIPEYYAGRPVTLVYYKSFYKVDLGDATISVIIPATVTTIESNAFYNSPGIGEIHILSEGFVLSDDVIIEGNPIVNKVLTYNSDPVLDSDFKLPRGMIIGCDSLYEITVPFFGAYYGDTENNYLGYLFGAEKRAENGEYLPKYLKNVTIYLESYIPKYAFAECSYLENIDLSYAYVEEYEENNTKKLQITEKSLVTYIGEYAFSNCLALKEFTIPNTVTEIGEKILENCSAVKTITIGSGIQAIPDLAKENPLFGIEKVTSSLEKYIVAEGNGTYSTDSRGVLYQLHYTLKEPVAVIDAPAKADLTDYVLPTHIVYIAPYAFAYNASLRWIQLDHVRRIDKCAFFGATSLVAAVFGQSNGTGAETGDESALYDEYIKSLAKVESMNEQYYQFIGDQAFMGCTQLRYVNLFSDFIIYIGDEAFCGCSLLEKVHLNKTLEGLGVKVFDDTHLEYIEVANDSQNFKSIDGVLYRRSLNNDGYILEVYPAYKIVNNNAEEKVYQTEFTLPVGENIVAIQSYAFSNTEMLQKVVIAPEKELVIGDYAFNSSNVYVVTIGENVSSIGLVRGEGEYTVFTDCAMLTAINVERDNHYYSSSNGVLFDKLQYKLIKYPAAKPDKEYSLPTSVMTISSMAFKENPNIAIISIPSYINTIGLEAFYGARNLVSIYFNHVYAPLSVMENAFTTQAFVDGTDVDPNTVINYSPGYFENSASGDYGWKNYDGIYNISECVSAPEYIPFDKTNHKAFYAIVVVDSTGMPIGNINVSLTDPHGVEEIIRTGYGESSTIIDNRTSVGTAMFYDLYGTEGVGFVVDYEHAYTLKVTDPNGKYFAYSTDTLMLDGEMCVTYVTLSMQPSVYGVDLSGNDINTETVDLNKAEYGKVQTVVQTKDGLEVVDTDVSETVEIKVVTYYDKTWSIDFANTTALYQNGSVILGCRVIEPTIYEESGDKKSAYIVFEVPVDQLIPEVPIEARVGMLNENGEADASASTFLNIDVIDFTVSADDVKIDSQSLNVNLSGAGEIIMSLIGNDGFSFNIGKNVQVSAVADGKTVTVSLNAGYKKSKSSGKNAVETDCEKGYKNNHDPHNKNTWFFKYPNTKIGKEFYTVNIRFARGTEKDGYLYYQTIVYKGYYAVAANEVDRFWGVVNVRGGRNEAKAKSMLIYYTYVVAATALEKEDKNVEKKDRIYTEPVITFAPSQSTSHNFEVTVYGDIQFQYEKGSGLVPVASTVKGDIKYSFKHNQQFMVWVIPVVLEITVDLEGNLVIKLKFDDSVTVEQARLTLKAEVMAKVGIGCQVLSAGVYGKIGMLFVLDFAPEVGVDKLKLYGGLYAYVTYVTIKFKKILGLPVPVIGSETKDLPIWEGEWYIIGGPDTDEAEVQYYAIPPAALYLADAYGAAESINYIENATLFVSGGKLYKLCFVNMTGEIASEAVGEYDEYNYLKLAVFEWSSESGSWVNPVILDDNGFNDFAYSIVKTNESIAVVFTQQTERTTADSAEDSYDYVSDLAVKYVDLSKLTSPAVFEVFDNEYYKYLPVFNTVNGVPTVVWVENTDNNMFGVSPKNYIDANGDVHIFATAANAIYKSEFVGESWSTPVCVANGLSTVMDLTITDDGRIVYVIDANADMSDASDRVAYSVINGSIVTEKLEVGKNSVMDLHTDGNNVYYYYENENGGGIAYYDFASSKTEYITVSGEDHISPDYEIIFDENGNVSAVVYSQIKTWEEGYESCDGTAIYGVFKSSEGFGDPVEITTKLIRTVNGVYISEFDAVLDENGNIMLSVEYIDGNGASLDRITDFYAIDSNICVKESEIDYKNCKITLTFENLGAIAGKVYYSINGGDRIELTEVLSGETIYAEIELDRNDLTPQITFFDGIVGEEIYRMDDIDLHHTDLRPVAKQLLLGSSNVLLVAVRNDGNVAGGGMLYIKVGDHTAEEMFAAEIVKPVRILNPGDILYFEIPLSGDITITDNTIVTLYVASADDSLEKGTTSENNILYTTLKAYQKNVGEFGTSYKPEVLTDKVTYDPMSGSNALPQIYFTCPESCNIETISIDNIVKVKDLDYTVFVNGVVGTIVLSEQTLISLSSGMHILTFTVGGENFSVELEKIRYYKITWIVSATEIKESFVAEGQAPIFVGTPEVSAPEGAIAVFKGWDADGDSKADKFKAVYSDAVYVALWKTEARKYKVSWVMLEEDGIPAIAEEFYRFGDVPEYKGTIFAPTDQAFMTWDKEITAVTGDVVYVATYYDKSTGGMSLNSKEITVFEDSEFEVIITASQIAKINEAVIELSYDVSVATLLGAEIFEGVAIIGAENGLITLKAMVAEGASEMQLIKLKMRAAKNPVKFANELFDIKSNVNLIKNLGNIKIFETGDVNLDGIISAADLSDLARHLARIETITDENMIKASDTSLDGRISAADITALAKYLAKIISSFENQNA